MSQPSGGGDGAQALVVATLEHGLEVTDAMMKFVAFSRAERKQLVLLTERLENTLTAAADTELMLQFASCTPALRAQLAQRLIALAELVPRRWW